VEPAGSSRALCQAPGCAHKPGSFRGCSVRGVDLHGGKIIPNARHPMRRNNRYGRDTSSKPQSGRHPLVTAWREAQRGGSPHYASSLLHPSRHICRYGARHPLCRPGGGNFVTRRSAKCPFASFPAASPSAFVWDRLLASLAKKSFSVRRQGSESADTTSYEITASTSASGASEVSAEVGKSSLSSTDPGSNSCSMECVLCAPGSHTHQRALGSSPLREVNLGGGSWNPLSFRPCPDP
jgi:hypothetical protein